MTPSHHQTTPKILTKVPTSGDGGRSATAFPIHSHSHRAAKNNHKMMSSGLMTHQPMRVICIKKKKNDYIPIRGIFSCPLMNSSKYSDGCFFGIRGAAGLLLGGGRVSFVTKFSASINKKKQDKCNFTSTTYSSCLRENV